MGDFNLNLLSYTDEGQVHDFVDLMYSYSFLPYITKPTRQTQHSLTLIDNIFSNCNLPTESGVIISDISDHFPIYLNLPKFLVRTLGKPVNNIQNFTLKD